MRVLTWRLVTRRVLLPNTAASAVLLLLGPALALLLWPRSQAQGLARLFHQSQLIQSFAAAPTRPPPPLWRQRLGPLAAVLWSRQQGVWWQFWGVHGDAGAFLVLPSTSLSDVVGDRLPVPPLRVDDLAVVAADPLSRQWLSDRLRSVPRSPRGLEQRCLLQLRQPQTVSWSPAGLGALAGPVAPLLQRFQQGCLTLNLQGQRVDLGGEAAAAVGVLGPASQSRPEPASRPLTPGQLLELRGPALEVLLQGLLSRQLVREPLASRYGIAEPQLALLRRSPFVLRLRELPQGPFQAGLELDLAPPARDRQAWERLLAALRQPLLQQGLQEQGAIPLRTRWRDEQGRVVGGWFWQPPQGGEERRLVLFVGPEPATGSAPPAPSGWVVLQARPGDLDRLGLWPGAFPPLVRRADQLEIKADAERRQPISRLTGRLALTRSR